MKNLARSIKCLKEEFDIVGLDDVLTKSWHYRDLTASELDTITTQTEKNVRASAGWPPNKANLNTDKIVAETLKRIHTLRVAETCE
jgi:hypothetical protein